MKAILPRQDLQDALTAITSLTSSRTPKPILSCVKLSAEGDSLHLSATDGEAGLLLSIPVLSLERSGETVVPADRLLGIVRELSDVEIELDAVERHCNICGEGSKFHIFVMDAGDFPPVPNFEDEPDLVLAGDELRRMIARTLYAAARETSRYAINGVLWNKVGKRLSLIATDGRRLARAGGSVSSASSADFEVIVPAKALGVFEKVFSPPRESDGWTVEVKVMPNQVLLRSGGRVLSSVLVEGQFPKYDDVIPKGNDRRVQLRREELLAAVRRAALLTTEESRAVKLSFDKDQLVITSKSPEEGEARIEMPVVYDGVAMQIAFNPAFLVDALRAISFEEVILELGENLRPGILCGEDKQEYLYVIMPVSL